MAWENCGHLAPGALTRGVYRGRGHEGTGSVGTGTPRLIAGATGLIAENGPGMPLNDADGSTPPACSMATGRPKVDAGVRASTPFLIAPDDHHERVGDSEVAKFDASGVRDEDLEGTYLV